MSYYNSGQNLNYLPSNDRSMGRAIEDYRNTRTGANTGMDQLTGAFKGMNIGSNYDSNRDSRLGVPPVYGQYDNYGRSGGRRKSRKSKKSRKSRKNNKSRRYRKR